jgi:HD-GYP domain-containing protein (c-di-GMP phosphodiesterase class II)
LKKLKEAGYLHDIGKIIIEESVINKESRLTDEETKEMQQQ